MSAISAPTTRGADRDGTTHAPVTSDSNRRLSTETKAAFKTTEFVAFLAIVVGILIAAAVTKAGAGHHDALTATRAWLYVSIVTVGYMVSRGLAKSGSSQHYDER
jgi:hypothetical protein